MKCMLPTTMLEEQPIFVNAQQYERILKRRIARSRQQQKRAQQPKPPKKYKYESRHKHACNRKRGPGGVFVAKEESEVPKKQPKYSRYSAACVLYGMPADS